MAKKTKKRTTHSNVSKGTVSIGSSRGRRRAKAHEQMMLPVLPRGTSGVKRSGGFISDEWHSKLRGRKKFKAYREMSQNNAIAGAYMAVLTAYMRGAEVNIEPFDDSNVAARMAEHVQSCVDDMKQTRREFTDDVVTAAPMGFSLHEIVYKVRRGTDAPLDTLRSKHDDGLVGWYNLPIRSQETITEWDYDKNGDVIGAYQQAAPDYIERHLPMEDCLLFRPRHNRGNPEGLSVLRPVWRSWSFLKRIEELEAIGIERDMAGLLVFFLPLEYFDENADDDQKQTIANYREINEKIRRGEYEGLVFPTPEDADGKTGWVAQLMQSGGRRPMDVNEIIKRLETRIAVGLMGEAILVGMQGNVGSWALSSDKTHMMAMGIKSIMDSTAETMTKDAIPRLIRRQPVAWPVALSPTWTYSDIESDAGVELAQSLAALSSSGFITPDKEIEDYLRVRLGLPEGADIDLTDGRVQDSLDRMAEQPQGDAGEAAVQSVVPIEAQEGSPSAAITAEQAAEQLGVSRFVINRAIRSGQLPGAKVGGTYRVMPEDLRDYMRGRRDAA